MKTILIFVLTMLLTGRPAFAKDGDLDPSFGRGGKVTTDFSGNWDFANAIAIQSDGKIVAAGFSQQVDTPHGVLARYNTDGGLDLTFGIDGKVSTGFFAQHGFGTVLIHPDGKIVVLGAGTSGGLRSGFIVRYNSDGLLDFTFGNLG